MSRQCGDCQLCCKLLPVREIGKPSNQRCKHQKTGKGCMVYNRHAMPLSCKLWNCRWLVNDDTDDLSRPDRVHYVIDIMPDYVTLQDDATGQQQTVPVLQIWVDPTYPDAWRDPHLKAFIARRGETDGMAALIRFGSETAISLFPPALTGGGWVERHGADMTKEATHTPADFAKAGLERRIVVEEWP